MLRHVVCTIGGTVQAAVGAAFARLQLKFAGSRTASYPATSLAVNDHDSLPTLASVVFVRIADYTRRPVTEQARLRSQLEAAVAVALNGVAEASRILVDAPDGLAVVVLRNPPAALDIAERCTSLSEVGVPLCIGINHGAVQLLPDDAGHPGLIGDAIGVAASIAEYGGPQRVTVTRAFADALAQASPLRARDLKRIGTYTDAQVRTHELLVPDRKIGLRRRQLLLAIGGVATVGLLGAAIATRFDHRAESAWPRTSLRDRLRALQRRYNR